MTITLTAKQQAWIDSHVARGEYASTEDAARRLIDAAILDLTFIEGDDLAWAKPLVDEALAQVERGEVISSEQFEADINTYLATLKA